jgi:hypothetical protein
MVEELYRVDPISNQSTNGVTYFAYGGAYSRPIYSGSNVYYEVVENPG